MNMDTDVDVDEDDYEDEDEDDDDEYGSLGQPSTPPESLPSDPYAHYIYQEKLRFDSRDLKRKKRRTIIVGDVHGHLEGFDAFLNMINHDPRKDIVILTGDMITRGPNSLEVIDRARKLGIKCVRGNHEDKVIRWRGFLDSLSLRELELLETGDAEYSDDDDDDDGRLKIPSDLSLKSEHYHLARKLTKAQYRYLRNCPLIYSVPRSHSLHGIPVHVMHAGLDPQRDILRQKPWVLINIRNVLPDGTPMRKRDGGEGWTDVFNRMPRSKKDDFMVVYGHDAGRSLSVKRRTVGLDTGCIYGKQLSGYVVETGMVMSMSCTKPPKPIPQ
ncbi:hypothetical protein BGX31_002189 [Mortierella sp. GBA43]|nr:hypothetical protein BGX31_002189 [Mortierella sp. GBA43]